jgi:hypothetical protein
MTPLARTWRFDQHVKESRKRSVPDMASVTTSPGRPSAPAAPKTKRVRSVPVQLWTKPAESAAWKAASKRQGLGLSEWGRRHLGNAAAAQDSESDFAALAAVWTKINTPEAFLRERRAATTPTLTEIHIAGELAGIRDDTAALIQRMLRRLHDPTSSALTPFLTPITQITIRHWPIGHFKIIALTRFIGLSSAGWRTD